MDGARPADQAMAVGLQKLMEVGEVAVKISDVSCATEYSIQAEDGEVLLEAKEEADCCIYMTMGDKRLFVMHLMDEMENKLFTLRRSRDWILEKLTVYAGDLLVCVVSQGFALATTVLNIKDDANRPMLRIKGGCYRWSTYKVQTVDKRDIGSITRESCWGSNYHVQFPTDLGVCYKAAVIGACILIDFMTVQ